MVVTLLRYVVVRAMAAGDAGEGELVERRAFELGAVALAGGGVFGRGLVLSELPARRARDGMGEAMLLLLLLMDGGDDGGG